MNRILYASMLIFACCCVFITSCNKKETKAVTPRFNLHQYYPNSGKAGTLFTIEGEGLTGETDDLELSFAGTAAEIISATQTRVVARAPKEGTSGLVSLSVGGERYEIGTYTYQLLSIRSVTPVRAQAGAQIRVLGEGFSSVDQPVKARIGDMEVEVISAADTLLELRVPAEGHSGPVYVSVDDMEAGGQDFTFMAIHEMTPLTGGAGTKITLKGEGFGTSEQKKTVAVNGAQATVIAENDGVITLEAPKTVKSGPVVLFIDGEAVNGPVFKVVPGPTIRAVSPRSGAVGTNVEITGDHFSPLENESHVFIGEQEVPVDEVTENMIRLTLPEGTTNGKLTVVVNDQPVTGPEIRVQDLGIVAVSPDNGIAGTTVTITGTGFSDQLDENTVRVNGVAARVVMASANTLTCVMPEGFQTGALTVTTDGLTAVAPTDFKHAGIQTLADVTNGLSLSAAGGSIAVDDAANVYVLEIEQHRITKISADGQVSVLAGSGVRGRTDGMGEQASFSFDANAGLVFSSATQQLYVSDAGNQALRSISLAGEVQTIVANFGTPLGKLALRAGGYVYIPKSDVNQIWFKNLMDVKSPGTLIAGYTSNATRHIRPAVDAQGNIYNVYNALYGNCIRAYKNVSAVSSVATTFWAGSITAGYVDNTGISARFNRISGVTTYDPNHLLVIDEGNYAVRMVDIATGGVETIAKGTEGFSDGDLRSFGVSGAVADIAVGKTGDIYLLDCGNNAVRRIFLQ